MKVQVPDGVTPTILVVNNLKRIVRYTSFFPCNCVHYRIDLDATVEQNRDEIGGAVAELGCKFIGFENVRGLDGWICPGNKPYRYGVDAAEYKFKLTDGGVGLLFLDERDAAMSHFDPDTLTQDDLVLKMQCNNVDGNAIAYFDELVRGDGYAEAERVLWAPYYPVYHTTTKVLGAGPSVEDKEYDLCFLGARSHPTRVMVFQEYESDSACVVSRKRINVDKYIDTMKRAKVCLNVRGAGVFAQRLFEIWSMRLCCLTDDCSLPDKTFWPISPVGGEFGECCATYVSGDRACMVEGVSSLLCDLDRAESLSVMGRRFWKCCFSPEAVREYGECVLESMLNGALSEVIPKYRSFCLSRMENE